MATNSPLTLFILKKFYDYGGRNQISNGLRNSCMFIVDLLNTEGYWAELVEAIDGNCIDRIVTQFKPARVVIEAIWVTPDKMAQLIRLHPSIEWTVRVHSELPFLANEGTAVEYLFAYLALGVEVAFNSEHTANDFRPFGDVAHLPNYYPLLTPRPPLPESDTLNIGCFGAIRPLKNQLIQAFAAIRFAQEIGKPLVFHMNGSRVEQSGNNVLKNIKALFAATGQTLVLHPWLSHEDFLVLIRQMDMCLAVSLSESFCIVAADAVGLGVPLIGSDAIHWLHKWSRAKVDSAESVCAAMQRVDPSTARKNYKSLDLYLKMAVAAWNAWV